MLSTSIFIKTVHKIAILYDKMLYPQYEDKFKKVITSKQFKKMQEVAAEKLEEKDWAHPYVVKHWESIVSGTVPFGYKLVNED